jgi:hypothetical protein
MDSTGHIAYMLARLNGIIDANNPHLQNCPSRETLADQLLVLCQYEDKIATLARHLKTAKSYARMNALHNID